MKKLSIEQKAKAYDKVVGKLLLFMAHGVDPLITRADVQDFFPELKESEDETTRNYFIKLFKEWLIDGKIEPLSKTSTIRLLAYLEKQGEQKPWSEEDKVMLDEIIDFFENGTVKLQHDLSLYASWLKSLRPHNNSVTDDELINARKDAYNDALYKIEYQSGSPTFFDGWDAAIWYLKKRNAKPQSTWKPSEEQMKALEGTFAALGGYDNNLRSLINDLKKL